MNKKVLSLLLLSAAISIPASATDFLTGRVTCQGQPLQGVVVTDGFGCTATDANGAYVLEQNPAARFVYLSTPAGYTVQCKDSTIPMFYQKLDGKSNHDFALEKNKLDDSRHTFVVQADPQVTSFDEIELYGKFIDDMDSYLAPLRGKTDLFAFDAGDMVGDSPYLFPAYIEKTAKIDIPMYRAIGNHDMTYGGRTFEYSYSTFEENFGPIYYSFNKGKAHYIVINNNFYVNRNYQYIGYIDERTCRWLEKDLSYVPADNLVFVVCHIPLSSSKELAFNTLYQDETSNAQGLFDILAGHDSHLITGHSHFNHNVVFNDRLMEHNIASACGIWWKADVCMDGTPKGFGVFNVDGNHVEWLYKSMDFPTDYQFRAYPVGASDEYPADILANVWNWDDTWKVEWLEDGISMGEMTHYTGFDPLSAKICADKSIVEYDWISPIHTWHMFRATPKNPKAKIEIRVTDRFGHVYTQAVK